MPHPLDEKLSALRRRARRMIYVAAIGWTLAASLAVFLLLGAVDYIVRFHDPGIRLIGTALALAAVGTIVYRNFRLPLSSRLSKVDLAQQLERRNPALADELSTAIAFLDQPENEPHAGSATLRRAAVNQAVADAERIDFAAVLDGRPFRRAIAAALTMLAMVGGLLWTDYRATATGIVRLAAPWGKTEWPRTNQLRWVKSPLRLAAGSSFEVELVDDGGQLPGNVRIQYRYDNPDGVAEEVDAMRYVDGQGGPRMVAVRENVTRPFSYRAVGGDDDTMQWTDLEVVEPPSVKSLEITLYPPEYTGWPPHPSDARIRALRGTRVATTGKVTKPLRSATLVLDDGQEITAKVSPNGTEFSISPDQMTIDQSTAYSFRLEDNENLVEGQEDPWQIEAIRDEPPTVTFEQPSTNLFVTPQAEVPLRMLVKDDLAIRDVELVFLRSDRSDEGEQVLRLYGGPQEVPVSPDQPSLGAAGAGESRLVQYQWNMQDLDLTPGTTLTVHARASDYAGQQGQSVAPRQITIIDTAQFEARMADQLAQLISRLVAALELQRKARTQTNSLEIQMAESSVAARHLDGIRAVQLMQREVSESLSNQHDGILADIERLAAQLSASRVESSDTEHHLKHLREQVAGLVKDPLPRIDHALTAMVKATQQAAENAPETGAERLFENHLTTIVRQQDRVIAVLEGLVGDLSQWADFRQLVREVSELLRHQEELLQAAKELGRDTIGQRVSDLDEPTRARLGQLADRQRELSRRAETIWPRLMTASERIARHEPLAAAALADASELAGRLAVSSGMRQAGDEIQQNRMTQAVAEQERQLASLQEIIDTLSKRREQKLGPLVDGLRSAATELAQLAKTSRGLRKKLSEVPKPAAAAQARRELERLSRRQQELREQLDRLARRLQRLRAEQSADSVQQAAGQIGQSCKACTAGAADQALERLTTAERHLDEAQRQLAEQLRQAEQQLARQQLVELEDQVRGLAERQEALTNQTARLESLRRGTGRFTTDEERSVHAAARAQNMLAGQTGELAGELAQTAVFQLALRTAAADMTTAAERLEALETGAKTHQAQKASAQRLNQLLTALDTARTEPSQRQESDEKGPSKAGQQAQRPRTYRLAEIVLLRTLQDDLNRRTRAIEQHRTDDGILTDDVSRQYDQLGRQQQQLAELVMRLAQPTGDSTNDDGRQLPDLDEQLQLEEQRDRDDELPPLDLDPLPDGGT